MSHNGKRRFLFAIPLVILLLSSAGYIDTVDADPSIETAFSLLERQSFITYPTQPDLMLYRPLPESGYISKLGIGMPFFYLLPVALAKVFSPIFGLPERMCANFFVSLSNAVVCYGLFLLLYIFFRNQNSPQRMAYLISISAVFATLMYPYSKSVHREPMQALCLLGVYVFLFHAKKRWHFIMAGTFAGVGWLCKTAFVIPLAPALLYGILQFKKPFHWHCLAFFGPLICAGALWFLFAYMHFGSFLDSGYSKNVTHLNSVVWSTPFWSGLYAQHFSPQSGWLFFCPLLLWPLSDWISRALQKQCNLYELCIFLSFLLTTCFYAKWWTPIGGSALGPRYLVPVIPILFLLLRTHGRKALRLNKAVPLYALLCFVQQSIFVSVKPQQFWTLQERAGSELKRPAWQAAPIFFYYKLKSNEEKYKLSWFGLSSEREVDLGDLESMKGFNYWWLHFHRYTSNRFAEPSPQKTNPVAHMNKQG